MPPYKWATEMPMRPAREEGDPRGRNRRLRPLEATSQESPTSKPHPKESTAINQPGTSIPNHLYFTCSLQEECHALPCSPAGPPLRDSFGLDLSARSPQPGIAAIFHTPAVVGDYRDPHTQRRPVRMPHHIHPLKTVANASESPGIPASAGSTTHCSTSEELSRVSIAVGTGCLTSFLSVNSRSHKRSTLVNRNSDLKWLTRLWFAASGSHFEYHNWCHQWQPDHGRHLHLYIQGN